MTEYEYESWLEANQSERAWKAQETAWYTDPDWQSFILFCYPDSTPLDAESIRRGVDHLLAVATRGHAPAQCELARALQRGQWGIEQDIAKAVAWYRAAAENGDTAAREALVVLAVTHPATM